MVNSVYFTSRMKSSVNLAQLASQKPADLDLHCFPSRMCIWAKHGKGFLLKLLNVDADI